MKIETLTDWNEVLEACGCCPMPVCPVPVLSCQSRTGDVSLSLYPPFVEPEGEDDVEFSTLYLNKTNKEEGWYEGEAWLYQGWYENPGEANSWGELLQHETFTGSFDSPGAWQITETGNYTVDDDGSHSDVFPEGDSFSGNDGIGLFRLIFTVNDVYPFSGSGTEIQPLTVTVNTTTLSYKDPVLRYQKSGGPLVLQGAGGSDDLYNDAWDVTEHYERRQTLTEPKTKTGLIQEAADDMPDWPEGSAKPQGTQCFAETNVDWVTLGEVRPYPEDEDMYFSFGSYNASASATGIRYRWQVPKTFTGKYFKITWDILEEPDGWDATIDDPDYEPPVPNDPPEPVPQIPDPEAPKRTFVSQDNVWEWTGPGDPDEDSTWLSDWYAIDHPAVAGRRRIVNIRYECYRSPYGNKPEVTGEGVTLPEPEGVGA